MCRNLRKFKTNNTHQKEWLEYIQGQMDKIRNSVENRQSWIAWQTINEVNRKKRTLRTKLKAASQEERLLKWKEHFENLLGNALEITNNPIQKIINVKLEQFTEEETSSLASWVECSPMVQETGVQSQVVSYQRL